MQVVMQVPTQCLAAGLPDRCAPMWSNTSALYVVNYDFDMIPKHATSTHGGIMSSLKVHEALLALA